MLAKIGLGAFTKLREFSLKISDRFLKFLWIYYKNGGKGFRKIT